MTGIPIDFSSILADLNPWWRTPGTRTALAWPVRRLPHRRLLEQLLRLDDRRAQVLLGPRQVGKTTLLRQLADDLLDRRWPPRNLTFFDCEDFRLKREVQPEELAGLRPPGADPSRPQILLLDELHRVPRWDRWLKHAVDNQLARIVATDSAASLLHEAGQESGSGRWDEIELEGLTYAEFAAMSPGGGEDATGKAARDRPVPEPDPQMLERYLALGGFPAFTGSDDQRLVRERLRGDVVDRAIEKDLAARVDQPDLVKLLLVYLVQESGSEQNASDRAADLGVDPRTVSTWIRLLRDTKLIRALDRGSTGTKASARLRARPKLYASDHGLVTAFAEAPDDPHVRSKVFEAVVYRHLREVALARKGRLRYLKWSNDLELDFLLSVDNEHFAVEVTTSKVPKPEKRQRLLRAASRTGATRAVLVHDGTAEGEAAGVGLLPVERFLREPWSALTGGS